MTTTLHASFTSERSRLPIVLIAWILLHITTNLLAQTPGELWGVANSGGQDDLGVIFKTGPDGTSLVVKHQFLYSAPGATPHHTHLIQATNGKLYGMTEYGGSANSGVLFEFDPATAVYTKKIDFNSTNGANPYGSLLQASNGKLYGLTNTGGANNMGVLFEYDISTGAYVKKQEFSGSANGMAPRGNLVQGTNGKLYGLTSQGGLSNTGVLFEFDPATSVFTKKYDFASVNGNYPFGSLVQAGNGKFYGMTSSGGSSSKGALFEYDPVTSTYTKKLDFTGVNGDTPMGSLMRAANGKLYGMTLGGGTAAGGVIFEYDAATNTYVKKHDINNLPALNGYNPYGSLMQASNGSLYGTTFNGGTNGAGVIFEYNLTTSTYTRKHNFDNTNGDQVFGSLMQASNGKIYGLTSAGGGRNGGVVFEYDLTTSTYTRKVDFKAIGNGASPLGTPVQGLNGKLYGLAGGPGFGMLYQYDPANSTLTRKVDFNGTNGSTPYGSLTRANGKLYGMTPSGGVNSYGVLFEYDPVTNTYTKKLDFESSANGSTPFGSLLLASNGKLYGMTYTGGANNAGVLFEYDPVASVFVKKIDFTMDDGHSPTGSLVQATNGKLYGLHRGGGTLNMGVLFEYDITTNVYTKKIEFTGTANGESPYGSLVEAPNGKLYGLATNGGVNNKGVLFEYNVGTNTLINKIDFAGVSNGASPFGTLVLSTNGKLYGLTQNGGTVDQGVLFEYDPVTAAFTKRQNFTGANGSYPQYNSLMVLKNVQAITFNPVASKTIGDAPFSLTATASSGLPISYSTSSTNITISGNQVTLTSPGMASVTALQGGDMSNLEAPSVTQSFCVNPASPVAVDGNRCEPGTVELSVTVPGGAVSWFAASSGGVAIGSGSTFTTPAISSTTTYYASVTVGGCASARVAVVATVNTTPSVVTTTPGSRCGNGVVVLGAEASAGSISWYSDATGGTSIATGNSFNTPAISANTSFYAEASINGCVSASRTAVNATIKPVPVVTGTGASRCDPGTLSLEASGPGNISWFTASTGGSAVGTGSSFTTPALTATTSYFVESVLDGCTSPARTPVVATITILSTPVITADNSNASAPVLTSGSPSGNQWFRNDAAIAGATAATYTVAEPGTYKVQVSINGCTGPFSLPQVYVVTALELSPGEMVSIYPNPASEQVIIHLRGFERQKPVEIVFIDMLGRAVHATQGNGASEVTIDVRSFQSGQYIIQLNQDNRRITTPFIKKF